MSFDDKIIENKKIVKKCSDLKTYNVGASRAYYCAFISIKRFLVNNGYDYSAFLLSIGKTNEREYSHSTIKRAFVECLLAQGKTIRNMSCYNFLDNLYYKRRTADYEDRVISQKQFDDSCIELDSILKLTGDF